MKKKLLILVAILSISLGTSTNVFASSDASFFQQWRSERQQRVIRQQKQVQHRQGQPTDGVPVGAPIDGGLLVVLASGGLAIYGAKKKKKNLT